MGAEMPLSSHNWNRRDYTKNVTKETGQFGHPACLPSGDLESSWEQRGMSSCAGGFPPKPEELFDPPWLVFLRPFLAPSPGL